MLRLARLAVVGVRWWFGLSRLVAGLGLLVWGPLALSRHDWGGVYLIVGGLTIAAWGWLIHPWGYEVAVLEV
jgi:hypothetical protein